MIISAFPGTGKTFFSNDSGDIIVADSDSSKFSWKIDENGDRVRNPNFVTEYVDHIQNIYEIFDIIMVSSHEEVRKEMENRGIFFTLVYPTLEMKQEYLDRYSIRESPAGFIEHMNANWEDYIMSCVNQKYCVHNQVRSEFISDLIPV